MAAAPSETKPKKRTATREARRQQLIDATIDSVAKHGLSGTTLSSVTKGANLSHGVVNFHFETKDALYDATLDYLAKEHFELWFKAMQNAGPKPEDQLAAIIAVDFHKDICTPKKVAVWYAFWGQVKYRPNYVRIYAHYEEKRFEQISRLCGALIADGKYTHLNADRCARLIDAVVDGLWLNLLVYPKKSANKERLEDCMSHLADMFPKHFSTVNS